VKAYETIPDFKDARDDEPCMAVWAVSELYRLGLDDHEVQVNEKKLRGRPVGRVRGLLALLPSEKRETWQGHISAFAKAVKPIGRAA
jgi:hypothetical protein